MAKRTTVKGVPKGWPTEPRSYANKANRGKCGPSEPLMIPEFSFTVNEDGSRSFDLFKPQS